jgi:hypothetical protein
MSSRRVVPIAFCIVFLGMLSLSAYRAQTGIATTADDTWDTFSVDFTVQTTRTNEQGDRVVPDRPPFAYRLERTRFRDNWQTTMTVLASATLPAPDGTRHPREIVRVVDDGDGTPLRMFTRAGDQVDRDAMMDTLNRAWPFSENQPATATAIAQPLLRRPPVSRDWVDGIVVRHGREAARLQAIQRRMGGSRGQVRGLLQFVQNRDNELDELLVDPAAMVPVEMNHVSSGALASHVQFEYAPSLDGTLRRHHIRAERVDPGSRWRVVTNIRLANHRFEKRR